MVDAAELAAYAERYAAIGCTCGLGGVDTPTQHGWTCPVLIAAICRTAVGGPPARVLVAAVGQVRDLTLQARLAGPAPLLDAIDAILTPAVVLAQAALDAQARRCFSEIPLGEHYCAKHRRPFFECPTRALGEAAAGG